MTEPASDRPTAPRTAPPAAAPASSAASPAASPPLVEPHPALPLFLWLLIQVVALSVAALRVPLSARFPPPGEQFALHYVLIAQVMASATLFPLLLRDARTSAMVILSIAPFIQLGAYLSSIALTAAARAGLYVALWLAALALWRRVLRSEWTAMLGVACAVALSAGGAVIWYVGAEAGAGGPVDWSRAGALGPLLGSIAQLHAAPASSWVVALTLLSTGAAAQWWLRNRKWGKVEAHQPIPD